MKPTTICLALGALPLLIYPFVLLANVMSLAAERRGNEPAALIFFAYGFLLGSLAYPAVWMACLILSKSRLAIKSDRAAAYISIAPLVYLAVVALFFVGWMANSR